MKKKLHLIITVCLAIVVAILLSVLLLRGRGGQNDESSTDVSANTEVSETVSDNDVSNEVSEDTSVDMSNSSDDDEISSEVSEREESQPANDKSAPSTPESSDDKTNNENSSNSENELEFSTSGSGKLYAVISDEDLKAGKQAVKEYAAKYIGKTPQSGKTAFNGNEILDFYNEAFLAVFGSRSGETDRFVSSRFDMDYSYILYDEASLSLPIEPFVYYVSYVGDGEALLEELCEYYFSHFTDEAAMELFPELVLYKGRLYDIVNDGLAGAGSVRCEEKYKITETDSGYEIQVSFYLSPEDIERYFMCTMEPSGLNKETGENVFTYSIIKEDGIWVFNTSKMHYISSSSDYGYPDWEFTY